MSFVRRTRGFAHLDSKVTNVQPRKDHADEADDLRVRNHANNPELVSDLLQDAGDLPVPLHEAELGVLKTALLGELLDDQARLAEVVAREAREEVVRRSAPCR